MTRNKQQATSVAQFLMIFLSLGAHWSSAAPADSCRIGLALSGGAARGLAHIGVIKVLEQEQIPVSYVSGNSMGAIVGGIYACGYSPAQMESVVAKTDWFQLFDDQVPLSRLNLEEREGRVRYQLTVPHRNLIPQLPQGALDAQNVYLRLKELTECASLYAAQDFDSLVVPYRAIAVDIASGKLKTFREGSVADALRASMAIPGVFSPISLAEGTYVDGGVIRFLPVEPLLEFKPDIIVAVDVGSPRDSTPPTTLLSLTWESFSIATERDHQEQMALADVLIRPDLAGLTASDFARGAELIRRGEEAAHKALPEIRRLIADRTPVARRRQLIPQARPIVRRIRIHGIRTTNLAVVRREITSRTGQPLDPERLIADARRVHHTGLFSQVTYQIRPAQLSRADTSSTLTLWHSDSVDVIFRVQEKEFGTYSLGMRYDQTNQFLVGAELAQENILGSGGGAGIGVTLGNPLQSWLRVSGARFFGLPFNYRISGYYFNYDQPLYDSLGRSTRQTFGQGEIGANAALGINLGRSAYLKTGIEARQVIFTPAGIFLQDTERLVALTAQHKVQTYSEYRFPPRGIALDLQAKLGLPPLGSDFYFVRAEGHLALPIALGQRAVFQPRLSAGLLTRDLTRTAPEESLPRSEYFTVGGPELAGAAYQEFFAPSMVSAGADLQVLLLRLFRSNDYPLYLTLSGDLAAFPATVTALPQVSDIYYGAAIGLSLTTPVGPVRVGYGIGKDNRRNLYLSAGYHLPIVSPGR